MINIYERRNIGVAEIQVVIGDIANQPDMDAVVNAANPKLLMGSGVSGVIFRAAGVGELTKACGELAPINVGEAIITPGFNLPNRHIIHCCGAQFKGDSDDAKNLSTCYRNTLELAEENLITSLAIPAISTGAYGFPIEKATKICINTFKEFSPDFDSLRIIRFVVSDEATAKIYASYLLETVPIPENAIRIDFDAHFSLEQFQRIRKGFLGDQDNKWFMYFEEPWFYIYRAGKWVGQCWFFLKFEPDGDGYKVVEAWVDNETLKMPEQELREHLYALIDEYLPVGNEYISLIEDGSCSYQVLRKGYVKLSISSNSISNDDVKKLGQRLIELANK